MHIAEDSRVIILIGSIGKPLLNDFLELLLCIKQHLHIIES